MDKKWSIELGGETVVLVMPHAVMPYAPTASDPPCMAIVTCAEEGILAFDGRGQKVWSYRTPSHISASCAAVGDIDGDGGNEVVTADSDRNLVCLGSDGKLKWNSRLRGQALQWNAPVIIDLDNDGHSEVIIGDDRGFISCFDGMGKLKWEFQGDRGGVGPISAGDVDGDGFPEIIFGTEAGRVYCVSSGGRWLWEMEPDEDSPFGRSAPVVADINGDDRMEVLIAKSNYSPRQQLYALDAATGTRLWEFETKLHVYTALVVGDINADGQTEIICGDKASVVYCLDGSGKEVWKTPLVGAGIFSGPVLADVNGDGLSEIITGVRSGSGQAASLYVLDSEGRILEQYPVEGQGIQGSPAVFDIDGDGKLEILFASSGPAKLICLETNGTSEALWPCYRGDPSLTGYVAPRTLNPEVISSAKKRSKVDIEMSEFSGPLLGSNLFSFDVSNPEGESLLISFSLAGPNGHCTYIERTKQHQAKIDFSCDILQGGEYTLQYSVMDTESRTSITSKEERFSLSPPYDDIAYLKGEIEAFGRLRAKLADLSADASAYLRKEVLALKGWVVELEGMLDTIQGFSEEEMMGLAEELTTIRREIARLQSISDFALRYGSTFGQGILAWSTSNPWRFASCSATTAAAVIKLVAHCGRRVRGLSNSRYPHPP